MELREKCEQMWEKVKQMIVDNVRDVWLNEGRVKEPKEYVDERKEILGTRLDRKDV